MFARGGDLASDTRPFVRVCRISHICKSARLASRTMPPVNAPEKRQGDAQRARERRLAGAWNEANERNGRGGGGIKQLCRCLAQSYAQAQSGLVLMRSECQLAATFLSEFPNAFNTSARLREFFANLSRPTQLQQSFRC
eukprot:205701-Pleurochrysis_carterae.AAC.1